MYPHDDNQGGFFVAVLERHSKDDDEVDAWGYSKTKQKPILDELEEFSKWYEREY
jgi:hypothetical protein